jgi:hypothetical protein
MIKSSFLHANVAVGFQLGFGLATDNWLAGGLGASMFFLGWEVTQRRYHIIEEMNKYTIDSKKISQKELPMYSGFDILNWNKDALLDIAFPVIATIIVGSIFA